MQPNAPGAPQEANTASTMMRYDIEKKSMVVAYLLWWFLGYFGAHRFYMGEIGSGIAMAAITIVSFILMFVLIGFVGLFAIFIWWIVDAFMIHQWVTQYNMRVAQRLGA